MEKKQISFLRNYLIIIAIVTLSFVLIAIFFKQVAPTHYNKFIENVGWSTLLLYVGVGFLAQMIDGSLGMAYGVSSTSFLMSSGVSPVLASASVHVAEVFTTASSGFFHWKMGNVDKSLFRKLVIPGALGAIVGAYFLTSFDGKVIKPYISAYLLIMGIIIIVKAFRKLALKETKKVGLLALLGGFVDASGGGGWGPVVTTTLVASGNHPAKTIGSVNASEFVIALVASGVFTIFTGIKSLEIVIGLIIGGLLASPLGAFITNKINKKLAMILVGILIIFLSLRTILISLGVF